MIWKQQVGMDSTQIVSVDMIVEIAKRAKGSLYGSIFVSSAQPSLWAAILGPIIPLPLPIFSQTYQ